MYKFINNSRIVEKVCSGFEEKPRPCFPLSSHLWLSPLMSVPGSLPAISDPGLPLCH